VILALPPATNSPIIHCPESFLIGPDQDKIKPVIHRNLNSTFIERKETE
jgi:hypothetical protein